MSPSNVYALLLSLLLTTLSRGVWAASNPTATVDDYLNMTLEELGQVQVSIATGHAISVEKAPATATIIDAEEIAAMGARTLDDVLETVPGFHVGISPITRMTSIYSIRGMNTGFTPQVLLLMDGVPVQSHRGSKPQSFFLPVAAIARVEVIRGPGSAIYGADAFSGVINVITKTAETMKQVDAGVRSGSFGSRELWAQGATTWHELGIAFSTNLQETDGDDSRIIYADAQTATDTLLHTKASLAPGPVATRYKVWDTHLALTHEQVELKLWHWQLQDAGVGAGIAHALDPTGYEKGQVSLADVSYFVPTITENWSNKLHLSYLQSNTLGHASVRPTGATLPIGTDGYIGTKPSAGLILFPDGLIANPETALKDTNLDFISLFSGWEDHGIRMALGTRHISNESKHIANFGHGVFDGSTPVRDGTLVDVSNTPFAFLQPKSRASRYVSLQDEWQLSPQLQLTTGVRYDHYSDFGSTTNPRLALVWSNTPRLTTKLLYGRAFRAPSFQELYFENNNVLLGNPNLKPEIMNATELSVNYRFTPELQTNLTLFQYRADGLIDALPDAGAASKTSQNARDQKAHGAEWEFNWKPTASLGLNASYSWQTAEDAATQVEIADAPSQQIKTSANWAFANNWHLNGQAYWVADRSRLPSDTRVKIPNYTWINLNLTRKNILPDLDVSFAIRNAGNSHGREPTSGTIPEDYPLEQRSGWLELRYNLN